MIDAIILLFPFHLVFLVAQNTVWTVHPVFAKMLATSAILLLSLHALLTWGQVMPTTPGPNETYTAGSLCSVAWDLGASGTWKNMTIGEHVCELAWVSPRLNNAADLMSGANNNMSLVTNVAMNLDGTNQSLTPYNWTCPEVDPYSSIYFYQVSSPSESFRTVADYNI